MLEEPTSLRIDDPGVRALFTEAARFQSWLDVEAALAQAQAELGIIPASAAREIVTKAQLKYLDLGAVRAGLAKTGHPLVPLVWELDRACEGDAGGYVHWGATTQNITQTGQLLQVRHAHEIFLGQLATVLTHLAGLAERTKDALLPGRTHGQQHDAAEAQPQALPGHHRRRGADPRARAAGPGCHADRARSRPHHEHHDEPGAGAGVRAHRRHAPEDDLALRGPAGVPGPDAGEPRPLGGSHHGRGAHARARQADRPAARPRCGV